MRQRHWTIEPGDIVSYVESWTDGTDELCYGIVTNIHIGRDLQSLDVGVLPWHEGETTLPISQVEGIWQLVN